MSLNDNLYTGPKLQTDITAILARWKLYRYAFSSDIIKMFRQISVHQEDRNWQRLVWREDPTSPILDYRLTTVMQGTAAAPFLAIRVLHQLAQDGSSSHPEAADLLRQQIYVDDVLGGADDLNSILRLRDQLIDLLRSAGMTLGKWAANHATILEGITDTETKILEVGVNEITSTLGITWLPNQDRLTLRLTPFQISIPITKRSILSTIAKIYDPLGWIAPVVIIPKVIMQDIWLEKLDWDQPISQEILSRWHNFVNSWMDLELISIQRWLGLSTGGEWHLHGFSDASKRAYAAVIYAVIPGSTSKLVMAKTKLAPTSVQTLPRLELCGSVLLVKLANHVINQLSQSPSQIHFWTDSKIVLDWLKGHPSKWQTFVANRVSLINSTFTQANWRHVRSSDNAADCATRGLTPGQLADFKLWWSGPEWLLRPQEDWSTTQSDTRIEETTQGLHALSEPPKQEIIDLIEKKSSFHKIHRFLAKIVRWRLNALKSTKSKNHGSFTVQEWNLALVFCFRTVQQRYFAKDIALIKRGESLLKSSRIKRCSLFIDDQGLLRVRGRLENASLTYAEKHPIILPGNNVIVKRYVQQAHEHTLHGGIQLTLSYLYRRVWIIQAPRIVTKIFCACVKCTRYHSRIGNQQMADLPAHRLTPQRPLAVAGLDYAGPIPILFSKGRGAKTTKGYLAIFTCFVVKAIHVEVVSDLTTDAFLAAYARFTARRGVCVYLYSDNVTTFRSAASELNKLFDETSELVQEIKGSLALQGTQWRFIPPRAPHFGGLWEAAVRSFKTHFNKIIGNIHLTYEEITTLAAKIEACLNSRPLCPIGAEPSEPIALTPGHFLVGTPCLSPPEPIDLTQKWNLRHRWTLITQLRNTFWSRWQKEIMRHMQQRNKWLKVQPNLKIGDIVILKDEQSPPATWPLGLVTETHPGKDTL